ncbi:MAG: rSAM/selenodomain-associated transferase 2/rSAM/selenodomain-associated transferase 1 [Urechidicola sp.]|jgi:rSAM/selenodomain-associated transferase 2/rSAM/selenodomain-associated transferase 1
MAAQRVKAAVVVVRSVNGLMVKHVRISISIIIPVLNEASHLKQNLQRLFARLDGLTSVEVIICDGGSTDHSVQIAHLFPCQVTTSPPGRAHQMNAASKLAMGNWLLFLHADTVLPADWTSQLTNDRQWGFFSVQLSGQHWFFRVIEKAINLRSRWSSIGTGDQTLFFERTFFASLQGFPPIPIMEDIAICKKARRVHKPSIALDPVVTSSRRWEKNGITKTIILMWRLRLSYWLGVDPVRLREIYYPNLPSNMEPIAKTMPVIQIFAKPPVEGKVKTRLIPDIGTDKATRVFRHCLSYTLDLLRTSHCNYQIWLSEETQDDVFQQETYLLQQGIGLGDRMLFALDSELSDQTSHKVILIGSDCLDLELAHFDQTLAALDSNDIVLLPTFDGGFALIGCRVIDPLLFNQVEWGSSRVLQQTIYNAKLLNYKVRLLEMVRDIDTLSDLGHYPELLSMIHQN